MIKKFIKKLLRFFGHVPNIVPVFNDPINYNPYEDNSDPEEECILEDIEESVPTSPIPEEIEEYFKKLSLSRAVEMVIWHCSATRTNATVAALMNYWRNILNWINPGYHAAIKYNGDWTLLLDFNLISNGVKGLNSKIINICWIGGIDENGRAVDNRSAEQLQTMKHFYFAFKKYFPHLIHEGHRKFSNKACPCFDVPEWEQELMEAA